MTESGLKKALVELGIGTALVAGIASYFVFKKNYLTWEEYISTVKVYQMKIEGIKEDCEKDVRCIEKDGQPKVIFRGAKNKKDVLDMLNQWIEDDEKNPKTYKLK